jgi:hypothetical protein
MARLLAKASEAAQAGNQFYRTLEQLDASVERQLDASVERHQIERTDVEGEDEEEEGEEDGNEPAVNQPDIKENKAEDKAPRDALPKTAQQHALEAEWGLYRSPQLSQNVDDEDEEETDDENERRRDTLKSPEEDFMVRPHIFRRGIKLTIA